MPAHFAPRVFGFVLSCLMSLLIIAPFRNAGSVDDFFGIYAGAWLLSWTIALPVVLVVIPLARRIVGGLIKANAGKAW